VEDDADTVADTKDARDASSPEGAHAALKPLPASLGSLLRIRLCTPYRHPACYAKTEHAATAFVHAGLRGNIDPSAAPRLSRATSISSADVHLCGCASTGDEEDVHDAPAAFGHCKPLAPMTRGIAMQALAGGGGAGEAAGQPTAEDGLGDDTLRVFYGNDTYYVLLRLHQYLYDRCGAAQSACRKILQ